MGAFRTTQEGSPQTRDMLFARSVAIFLLVVAIEATPTIPTSAHVAGHVNSYMIGGVTVKDTAIGDGPKIKKGDKVVMSYAGTLDNGKSFDSNQHFEFTWGVGQVIKGWDLGLQGMKVGGKRTLVIPSSLGYGDAGAGGVIPGGATLHFDVGLKKIE